MSKIAPETYGQGEQHFLEEGDATRKIQLERLLAEKNQEQNAQDKKYDLVNSIAGASSLFSIFTGFCVLSFPMGIPTQSLPITLGILFSYPLISACGTVAYNLRREEVDKKDIEDELQELRNLDRAIEREAREEVRGNLLKGLRGILLNDKSLRFLDTDKIEIVISTLKDDYSFIDAVEHYYDEPLEQLYGEKLLREYINFNPIKDLIESPAPNWKKIDLDIICKSLHIFFTQKTYLQQEYIQERYKSDSESENSSISSDSISMSSSQLGLNDKDNLYSENSEIRPPSPITQKILNTSRTVDNSNSSSRS